MAKKFPHNISSAVTDEQHKMYMNELEKIGVPSSIFLRGLIARKMPQLVDLYIDGLRNGEL